jgi:sugar lactone lactonase YvrE
MGDSRNPGDESVRRGIKAIMANDLGKAPAAQASSGARLVARSQAVLGEGPRWSTPDGCIYWVDIAASVVHRTEPDGGTTTGRALHEMPSALALARDGGLVAATRSGLHRFDFETGLSRPLASPEGLPVDHRCNDAACDSHGRLWFGTLSLDLSPGRGSLYRLDPDGSIHAALHGLHMPNGLGWSPDGRRFYFTETALRRILVYDFDAAAGSIAHPRVFAELPEENIAPDGLAVDEEGYVWSAQWNGWRIVRYDPAGRVDRVVPLPVPRPTSCVFGGRDMSTLYITSATYGLTSQQLQEAPWSGSLLAIDAGVRGLAAAAYGA